MAQEPVEILKENNHDIKLKLSHEEIELYSLVIIERNSQNIHWNLIMRT